MLTYDEHIDEAQSCLITAQRLDGEGKRWQSSEILWSAVKHSISAIAILTGQEHGKYQHKRAVVQALAAEFDDPYMAKSLKVAMQIHANADKGFLTETELRAKQQEVRYFIRLLLNIATDLTPPP